MVSLFFLNTIEPRINNSNSYFEIDWFTKIKQIYNIDQTILSQSTLLYKLIKKSILHNSQNFKKAIMRIISLIL